MIVISSMLHYLCLLIRVKYIEHEINQLGQKIIKFKDELEKMECKDYDTT